MNEELKEKIITQFYQLEFDSEAVEVDWIISKCEEVATRMYEDTKKAFGGCVACFGKGYSTTLIVGTNESRLVACECERGKQLKAIIHRYER